VSQVDTQYNCVQLSELYQTETRYSDSVISLYVHKTVFCRCCDCSKSQNYDDGGLHVSRGLLVVRLLWQLQFNFKCYDSFVNFVYL